MCGGVMWDKWLGKFWWGILGQGSYHPLNDILNFITLHDCCRPNFTTIIPRRNFFESLTGRAKMKVKFCGVIWDRWGKWGQIGN